MVTAGLVAAAFLAGVLVGRRFARRRAYLVCQRQAIVDNAFRPAVADGFNPTPRQRRRRSPNEQFVWRQFPEHQPRPVFDPPRP
jgi:hypothetical protein